MQILRVFKYLSLFIALLGLTACENTIIRQTDNVQETVAKRGGVKLALHAANQINLDAKGHPRAVRVKVYQLANTHSFVNADFRELAGQDFLVLGDALVRQTEVTIKPGQTLTLALDQNIAGRYLGVVAFFDRPDSENWRVIKAVSGDVINVGIDRSQVFLQ